jgi:hypothetical protein
MFDTAEEIQRYGRHKVYRSHRRYSKQIKRLYLIQQRIYRDTVDIKYIEVIVDTVNRYGGYI